MDPRPMTTGVLLVVGVVVAVACLFLAGSIVIAKVVRRRQLRVVSARQAPLRPLVLAVAAGEDDDGSARRRLATVPAQQRPDVRALVVSLLSKVRGAPVEDLVGILHELRTVEQAQRALRDRSPVHRARAARVLGLVRDERHVPELVRALQDRSPEVRLVAARALGMVGHPSAAPAVLAALRGSGTGAGIPASIAAEALIGMGVGAGPALREALHSDDATMRAVAAGVAGVGLFASTAPRLRVLLAGDPDEAVRRTAAQALGHLGGPGDVPALVRSTEADRPAALRRVAAEALGELGDRSAVPALVALLADGDRRLAQVSADSLARIGREGLQALRQHEVEPTPAGRAARGALAMEQLRTAGRPA